MMERVVEDTLDELPQIDETLEKVMVFSLEEAKEALLDKEHQVVPFTCLVVGENLFKETHPGTEVEDFVNAARHTVQGARGADAYTFCYDGYVDTDDGQKDALIAEGGLAGEHDAFAVAYLYTMDDDNIKVQSEPVYVGHSPNFMEFLTPEDSDVFDDSKYVPGDDMMEDGQLGGEQQAESEADAQA